MQHTPGPWYCDTKSGDVKSLENKFICNPEGYGVVKGESRHGDAEEALANSHLIAAAPDLLEACKSALLRAHDDKCATYASNSYPCTCYMKTIESAIAKAESFPIAA